MKQFCYNCMRPMQGIFCQYCRTAEQCARAPYHITPGTKIAGRYIVGRSLGEGGFGITYIGFDERLNRRVAIKEYYPSGAANRHNNGTNSVLITRGKADMFNRGKSNFLTEARAVARFTNEEGIVDIYDFFEENNTAYIIMEYLEGITLKQRLQKQGVMNPAELIHLLMPLMRSLGNMHRQNIIHRDISPDNIMITATGKLKLMDFGSARYYANEERELSVILKHGYAPEEQYRPNGKQGPYTDIYALCATIYTCITGSAPVDSLDRMVRDTLMPPSRLGVAISPVHEYALMHGLAVHAVNRTQDMNMLMRELSGIVPSPVAQNGNGANSGKRKMAIAVTIACSAIAVALLAAVVIILLNQNKSNNENETVTTTAAVTTVSEQTNPETEEPKNESSQSSAQTPDTKPVTEPVTKPATEPVTEDPVAPTKYRNLDLSESNVNDIVKDISRQYDKTMENNADRTSGNYRNSSRYRYIGNYSIFHASDGSYRIITPRDRWGDGLSDRSWYYFDSNGALIFIFKIENSHQYRYYIYKDQIIKYTYAEYEGADQDKYYYGNSILTDSLNDTVIGEAKQAQQYVLSHE